MTNHADYLLQIESHFTPTEKRLFLLKKVRKFVAGELFTVGFTVKNKGERPFYDQANVTLNIELRHPDGRTVIISVPFQEAAPLPPRGEFEVEPIQTGALSQGTVLVTARTDPGIPGIQFQDKFGHARGPGIALDSVFVTTWQEVYQYHAMWAAVLGFIFVVVFTVVDIILRFF